MRNDDYYDMRNIASPAAEPGKCPVAACAGPMARVSSQWGEMPYCTTHRIRIHHGSRTFVYYNGADTKSKRAAALRNLLFETGYFERHILGNKYKAESHRFCNETSEDALTWNVFSRLATRQALGSLLSNLTTTQVTIEPELYLWGLRINFLDSRPPEIFPALQRARNQFEGDIRRFLTEPDIMLYVPGKMLVVIEAKFTSGNTVAKGTAGSDLAGEKPKSRGGIMDRYPIAVLPMASPAHDSTDSPFYAQLYRNMIFAAQMAQDLKVSWMLLSLVSRNRFSDSHKDACFRDPTPFFRSLLSRHCNERFRFYSWEQLYLDQVANRPEMNDLAEYMYDKSANGLRALSIASKADQRSPGSANV